MTSIERSGLTENIFFTTKNERNNKAILIKKTYVEEALKIVFLSEIKATKKIIKRMKK